MNLKNKILRKLNTNKYILYINFKKSVVRCQSNGTFRVIIARREHKEILKDGNALEISAAYMCVHFMKIH